MSFILPFTRGTCRLNLNTGSKFDLDQWWNDTVMSHVLQCHLFSLSLMALVVSTWTQFVSLT